MTTQKHILVVDDEVAIRYAIGRSLRHAGYVVSEAADGMQAKRMVLLADQNHAPFDLLLLDVMMPLLRGDVLIKELATHGHCSPVLLMTGCSDETHMHLVGTDHCVGVLLKPFELVYLLKHMARAFSRVQHLAEQGNSHVAPG